MKVDPHRTQLKATALRVGLEKMAQGAGEGTVSPTDLADLVRSTGASTDDVRVALEQSPFAAQARGAIEKLLAQATVMGETSNVAQGAKRAHELRSKHQPWWTAVKADALPPLLYPEPARDVEFAGERFSKDDVLHLMRVVAGR